MTQHAGYRTVAVTFVTLAVVYGVWYAYSVFLVALLQEFGWSRSLLAGAFSVFAFVHGCLSPTLGWLGDRIGPRRLVIAGGVILSLALFADGAIARPWHLYLAFGGLTALGVATAGWVPAVMLAQRWFPDRAGLALGITGSGVGVGIFLVVPLCQLLIDGLGWRAAFRVLGALAAAWVIPATLALVREAPLTGPAAGSPGPCPDPPAATTPGSSSSAAGPPVLTLPAATRGSPFWLLAGTLFLGSFCTQTLLVHQAAYLVDHGFSPLRAASVVSLVGLSSILGKTGGGWLSDRIGREAVFTAGMGCVLTSMGLLGVVALTGAVPAAYGYGILVGLGYSVTASLMPAAIADRFRGPHFGSIFGTLMLFTAMGGSAGPWVAGRIFDVTGSYRLALVAAASAAVAATTAFWLARRRAIVTPRRDGWGVR